MALVARRLLSEVRRGSFLPPARYCSFHKKPFLDTLDQKVELEGPNAPKWWDSNEEFWSKAEDYVRDQPAVPVPWDLLALCIGGPIALYGIKKLFLDEGSAGLPWISPWINQDKYLMWGLDPEFMSEEDEAVLAMRREEAKKVPLYTRILEQVRPHPDMWFEKDRNVLVGFSRVLMSSFEQAARAPRALRPGTREVFPHIYILEAQRQAPGMELQLYDP